MGFFLQPPAIVHEAPGGVTFLDLPREPTETLVLRYRAGTTCEAGEVSSVWPMVNANQVGVKCDSDTEVSFDYEIATPPGAVPDNPILSISFCTLGDCDGGKHDFVRGHNVFHTRDLVANGDCAGNFRSVAIHFRAATWDGAVRAATISNFVIDEHRPAEATSPVSTPSEPADILPHGHVAYGIGAAAGHLDGFRQALDAAAGIGLYYGHESHGPVLGGAISTGFGKYPTYLAAEGGYSSAGMLTGYVLTGGLVYRAAPTSGYGLEVSAAYQFIVVQFGARAIAVTGRGGADVQLTGFLGAGFF